MKITFKPQTEWLPPQDFPDLSKYDEIAVDLETKDPNLNERMGSGSVVGVGDVVGISLATTIGVHIILSHMKAVVTWIVKWSLNGYKIKLNLPSTKIFHNAMYDVCWLRALG